MRTKIVLASAAFVACVVACASSDDAPAASDPPEPASVPDGGEVDGARPDEADADVPDARPPACSDAGWCITELPEQDIILRDIVVFEETAFAIARVPLEGVKILEWSKATNAWKYIDDGSQNVAPIGTYAGRIYAPSVDEVYFTVGPSHVFHGRRAGASWTWTNQALPETAGGTWTEGELTTFGVWGTSANDVYAYFGNTIFRRDPSTGVFGALYVADDLDDVSERIVFTAVQGTGDSDLFFVGARVRGFQSCPLAIRKTASGWERVADGIATTDFFSPCLPREGSLFVSGADRGGWFADVVRVNATEYAGLYNRLNWGVLEGSFVVTIRTTSEGASLAETRIPVSTAGGDKSLTSLWRSDDATWFTGWGLVLRATLDGEVAVSTLARSGAPLTMPLHKIRGTSNQNLWAIGGGHAYHKTTP